MPDSVRSFSSDAYNLGHRSTSRYGSKKPDGVVFTGSNLTLRTQWAASKTLEMGAIHPAVNMDGCLDDIEAFSFRLTDSHV